MLTPSNFKAWRSDVSSEAELIEQLAMFQSTEKSAPVTEVQTDMLCELLLKLGLGALGVHAHSRLDTVAGVRLHRVSMPPDRELWVCFETYQAGLKDEIAQQKPAQVVMLNSCFVGPKADESLANLQLELSGLGIVLTVI